MVWLIFFTFWFTFHGKPADVLKIEFNVCTWIFMLIRQSFRMVRDFQHSFPSKHNVMLLRLCWNSSHANFIPIKWKLYSILLQCLIQHLSIHPTSSIKIKKKMEWVANENEIFLGDVTADWINKRGKCVLTRIWCYTHYGVKEHRRHLLNAIGYILDILKSHILYAVWYNV